MNSQVKYEDPARELTHASLFLGNIAIAAITGLMLALPVQAESRSYSKNLIVEQPADLPEIAHTPGESLFLYQTAHGQTYLYVEQKRGTRLSVLDVTDPANIKTVTSVALNTGRAFDFVRQLSDEDELIRFRDNGQIAVLNVHKPEEPMLKIANAINEPGHTESLGQTGFLMFNVPYTVGGPVARDYKVVDLSNPAGPTPLATIEQVKNRAVDEDTGATYLLGSDGLTVIRRPRVEDDYKLHQIQKEPN